MVGQRVLVSQALVNKRALVGQSPGRPEGHSRSEDLVGQRALVWPDGPGQSEGPGTGIEIDRD